MTLDQLKTEHPEVYQAAVAAGVAEGVQQGVAQERARIAALQKWAEADAQNERVLGIVKEAVATGKTEAEVLAQLQVAVRDAKPADPDNPPAVKSAAARNGAGGADPELAAMAAKASLTPEELVKYGPKDKEGRK